MARYNVIMAGKYRVGKSSLFGHLSRDPTKSLRGWDKFEHVVDLGSEQVQVVLWDTASMEKNSVLSMSKSYFTECVGVIMVYRKGDVQSLMELDSWYTRIIDHTQYSNSLVFSLWCNDVESFSDEISDEHREGYMSKWRISPGLSFHFSSGEEEGEPVLEQYKTFVRAVVDKCNVGRKTRRVSLQAAPVSQSTATAGNSERINLQDPSINNAQKKSSDRGCGCF